MSNDFCRILFACILISPFLGAIFYGLYCQIRNIYLRIHCRHVAPNQHLMFCQLSKGDVVWAVIPGEKPECYYVKNVSYRYDKDNKLNFIRINLHDDYIIIIPVEKSKSFKFADKDHWGRMYYTLMGEAMAAHNLCMSKRNSEIEKIRRVSPAEVKKVADDTIKELENLKKKI